MAGNFLNWIDGVPAEVGLILGNHDGVPRGVLGTLNWVKEDGLAGIRLLHHPDNSDHPSIGGHVHPMVRLRGQGRESFRLPCYWQRKRCLILPAFGGFTGGYDIEPADDEKVWVVASGRVVEVARRMVAVGR